METALNSGLSFIKHVDCGRGVSKEAHKVLIEKTKKKCRFLLLASEMGIMLSGKHGEENGSIKATEDYFFVNLFLCKRQWILYIN